MLKRYNDFEKINENTNPQIDVVKSVISKWLGDPQKAEAFNAKFQRFIDSPKYGGKLKFGLFQWLWYFLLGNFFSKADIETNGLIKEFYEILNSTNPSVFVKIKQNEENAKKMVISLFGNTNAALQSLKKGDYTKAKGYLEKVFSQYMKNSGFFPGRGEDLSIFTTESISRMKTFMNLLMSPDVSSTPPDSKKPKSVISKSSVDSIDKLDKAVKKLVDTF